MTVLTDSCQPAAAAGIRKDGAGTHPAGSIRTPLLDVVDPESFHTLSGDGCDGVMTGSCTVAGRTVLLWAQDGTYRGGSLGRQGGALIADVIETADRQGVPVLGWVASGGARIQEGVGALDAYARIFRIQARASVPQIALIGGTCAGGGAYSPALGDFVITVGDTARLFLTGPRVVHQALGEEVSAEALGGARVHARNGVAHLDAADTRSAASLVRQLLDHLPAASGGALVRRHPRDPAPGPPDAVLPALDRQVYDIRGLVARLVDGGELLELAPRWASNIVVGVARLDGYPVGVIANQPRSLGGTLNVQACEKGSWFVQLCDRFGLPLAVIVDTPGFLPGTEQERSGVIRHGADLVRAFAQARVPRATVVVRAAYGGAQIAMNSRGLGATLTVAWPGASIGVMGGRQAIEVIGRGRIAAGEDARALVAEYEVTQLSAARAVAAGAIDRIVEPEHTRALLISALTEHG